MDDPDDNQPRKRKLTIQERRELAKKERQITRARMQQEDEEAAQEEERRKRAFEDERLEEQRKKEAAEMLARDEDMARHLQEEEGAEKGLPSTNPLLLPRDLEREVESSSSTSLECGCGGVYQGRRQLKVHVNMNPTCMPYWGGDLPSLKRKVDQEFNRRRSANQYKKSKPKQQERKRVHYEENKEQEQERQRVYYEKNKEKEQQRHRVYHEKNKEKEQERDRAYHEKNKEKEQERHRVYHEKNKKKEQERQRGYYEKNREKEQEGQRVYYERNKEKEQERKRKAKEQQTPTEKFEKEGRYGPIFSCISCHQTNWFSNVVITSLENVEETNVDKQYVVSNLCLFQKQNRLFICLGCKKSLETGTCPKMSTRNSLQCPWQNVPRQLLKLTVEENCLISPVTLFALLRNTDSGHIIQQRKIIVVPRTQDFLADGEHQEETVKIIRGNMAYKGTIRPELIREAFGYLNKVGNTLAVRKVTDEDLNSFSVTQDLSTTEADLDETVDAEDDVVLLPDDVSLPDNENHAISLLTLPGPYSKTMCIFFPDGVGDFDDERNSPVTELEWIGHILRNVRKELSEFTLFPFTAAYRMDMKQRQAAFNSCTGYKKAEDGTMVRCDVDGQRFVGTVQGSSEYYLKHRADILAKCDVLGYPTLFITMTNSDQWDVLLSTALSQDGYDVWHAKDEKRLLGGGDEPSVNEYFVHEPGHENLCPYHPKCRRVSIHEFLSKEDTKKLLDRNLYSSQRIFCQRTGAALRNLIMTDMTGLCGKTYHFLKEFGSRMAHTHGVVWQTNSRAVQELRKMHSNLPVRESGKAEVIKDVHKMVTATLNPNRLAASFEDLQGERSLNIVRLAEKLQRHFCGPKCVMENDGDGCLYHFPRLPTDRTIICSPLDESQERDRVPGLESQSQKIKRRVRDVLENLDNRDRLGNTSLTEVLLEALGDIDEVGTDAEGRYRFKGGGLFPPCWRLSRWLQLTRNDGYEYPALFAVYSTALSTGTWRVEKAVVYQLILKRTVAESFTVDYNPYLLECMRSNMEVRILMHSPNLVVNYMTKAEAKPSTADIVDRIRQTGGTISGGSVASCAQDYRKVSLAEAFFRADNRLFFSNTDMKVIFVNTNFPSKRGTMYRVSDSGGICLPGREGNFEKAEGVLNKYSKRPREPLGLEIMSSEQYAMMYTSPMPWQILRARERVNEMSDKAAVVGGEDQNIPVGDRMLPHTIELADGTLQILRTRPVVVDHSNRELGDSDHGWQYSQILLSYKWRNESEDLGILCSDPQACEAFYNLHREHIEAVKEGCRNLIMNN